MSGFCNNHEEQDAKTNTLKNNNKNKELAESLLDVRKLKILCLKINNPFLAAKICLDKKTDPETTETTVALEDETPAMDLSCNGATETTPEVQTDTATETTTEPVTETTRQEETTTTQKEQIPTEQAPESSDYISRMLYLINSARAERGIAPLCLNGTLNALACSRCADMLGRNYFSHTTPEGKNVYTILQENGIGYSAAGENIANSSPASSASADLHFNIWINSSTHRDNILNGGFSQIGIGFGSAGSLFISTLIFIG